MKEPWTPEPARLARVLELVMGAQLSVAAPPPDAPNGMTLDAAAGIFEDLAERPHWASGYGYASPYGQKQMVPLLDLDAVWEGAVARGLIPAAWLDAPERRFKAFPWTTCPACGGRSGCHPGCEPYLPRPGTLRAMVAFLAREPADVLALERTACEALGPRMRSVALPAPTRAAWSFELDPQIHWEIARNAAPAQPVGRAENEWRVGARALARAGVRLAHIASNDYAWLEAPTHDERIRRANTLPYRLQHGQG